jgi:Glyoxalase-like domain
MAPISFQVTVDCDDPHAQAKFWAAALRYEQEDHAAFVQEMLDAGIATEADVVTYDGRLAWRTGAAIRHPDGLPVGRVLFQLVDGPRPARNSWHLDLNVGKANIDAEVARLTTLGAREQYKVDEPGAFHTTMTDPEGNLFCVQ